MSEPTIQQPAIQPRPRAPFCKYRSPRSLEDLAYRYISGKLVDVFGQAIIPLRPAGGQKRTSTTPARLGIQRPRKVLKGLLSPLWPHLRTQARLEDLARVKTSKGAHVYPELVSVLRATFHRQKAQYDKQMLADRKVPPNE